ncbi:MAG: hypothetical protein ACR2OU_14040 [Thermomicrobiales bacterium]
MEHAIHGIHSVTLWVDSDESANHVLADELGFQQHLWNGAEQRLIIGEGLAAQIVNVRTVSGFVRGTEGAGTVHHVAWSLPDGQDLTTIGDRLSASGFDVSEIIDRQYFRARYARERGGILHELATLEPGFTVDEPVDHLGERLMIPPEWARIHAAIEERMPPLRPAAPQRASKMFAGIRESPAPSGDDLGFAHRFLPRSGDTGIQESPCSSCTEPAVTRTR